jgi:antitoxin component of MazEF toxin-antitoxin module
MIYSKKKGVENSRYTRLLRNGKYKFNTRQNSSNYKIIANRNTIQNYLRDSSQISLEKNNKDTIIFKAKNRKKLSDNITKYRHTINFNRDNSNLFEFFNNKNPNFPLNYYL